ncbi:MAG: DUF423 domain-containing protein [Pseudomonadota bacterium]|nr:DUF423 domain-containing protein [Pseudomonadota bacterium]
MAYMKTGLWLLATAIIFGAFGVHGLQALVTPERLETWETAVRYHAWISLFLIAIAWTSFQISDWVYRLVVFGLLVFSGSLYLLVLFDTPLLGAITPIGGILMITGIVTAAITCRSPD